MPVVNWLLAAATLGAVIGFGTSDALAGAYGIAVSLLMAITTLLAALVALHWGYHPIVVIPVNGFSSSLTASSLPRNSKVAGLRQSDAMTDFGHLIAAPLSCNAQETKRVRLRNLTVLKFNDH